MPSKIGDWCRHKLPVLFEDKMPIWLTIVASLAAATGAYFISPAINRQFQIDEARSAHVAKATDNLNEEIIALSQKVRRLNDALVNSPTSSPAIREDCLDLITKLQWMLVDLRVVLNSPDDQEAIGKLAHSLTNLKSALDKSVDARAQPELLAAMRDLGDKTRDVLGRLYVTASLK